MMRILLAFCMLSAVPPSAAAASQDVNPRAAALKEFADRTRDYMHLHEQVEGGLPKLGDEATPEQLQQHQKLLAEGLRALRRHARQGQIFTEPVVPQFRATIRRDLKSRDIRDALAALQEVPATQTLRVNGPWPSGAARATVPPRLLKNLHRLPDGLEYRFIGRHLVLVDTEASLIVDYITDVVPSMLRRR
jgi:hypothetical protein